MVRTLAICGLFVTLGSAAAETSKDTAAASPQPTVALQSPASASACGKSSCPHSESAAANNPASSQKRQLKQKLAELNCLQNEIEELRRATGTPQQILTRVQVLEVSRKRLQSIGTDFSDPADEGEAAGQLVDTLLDCTKAGFEVRTITDSATLQRLVDSLQRDGVVKKVLANPSIATISGRPASLEVGGRVPLPAAPGSDQQPSFVDVGTHLDVHAVALGDHRVRLDLRVRVSEIDEENAVSVAGNQVPFINRQQIDSAIELALGETGVLSGPIQRTRHEQDVDNEAACDEEVQLLFLVTTESADSLAAKPRKSTGR